MAWAHGIVTCIVNDAAGSSRGLEAAGRLGGLFARSGVEARVLLAHGSEVTALARRAVEEKNSVVVGGGGDGTMNAVASALVGTDVVLGVLPLGTLNHFAKDLKIPLELDAAVANIVSGQAVRIDVGEVNGRMFLNNSSLGIYPWLVRRREELQRQGYGKWTAFAQAAVAVANRYSRLYVRLRTNEQRERERETPFVFVGNNRYEIVGVRLGERTSLDRGQLWICRAPRAGHIKLLGLAIMALAGLESHKLETVEAPEVWIETKSKRVSVATDGEVTMLNSPLHYLSRAGALNVIVPASVGGPVRP